MEQVMTEQLQFKRPAGRSWVLDRAVAIQKRVVSSSGSPGSVTV